MTRLRHSQLEALSKALLEIHVPGVLESLPERFFNAVRRFLTCDIYCYNELRNDQAIRFVDEPEYRGEHGRV
jgi:hypothetical protein